MISRADRAAALFKEGFNCSQAVFATYADLFGMDRNTALRVSASFGAGVGRMREVCGAASGMFFVAGLLTGSIEGKDQTAKKNNYEIVQFLAQKFKERNGGSYICRELLGLDKKMAGESNSQPDASDSGITGGFVPQARTEEYYKKRPCPVTIHGAAEIIEEILLEGLVETAEDGTEYLVEMESYTEFLLDRIHKMQEEEEHGK